MVGAGTIRFMAGIGDGDRACLAGQARVACMKHSGMWGFMASAIPDWLSLLSNLRGS